MKAISGMFGLATESMAGAYPDSAAERSRWIVERRSARTSSDILKPHAFFVEDERSASGEIVPVATLFLTNRECPWRCLMCDLWRNTTEKKIPAGAVLAQIDHALTQLPSVQQIKLYNSGSFFDPRAIPREDLAVIAQRVSAFEHVIVECHPKLIDDRVRDWAASLAASFEVAMGLECSDEVVLSKLNKGMTTGDFTDATGRLVEWGIAVRAFVLIQPPFTLPAEAVELAVNSARFAFAAGASVVSLIPLRLGNGATDDLARQGLASEPKLEVIEQAFEEALALKRGRVFVDTWDMSRFAGGAMNAVERAARLAQMNLTQQFVPRP